MGAILKKLARSMYHTKTEEIKEPPEEFFEIEVRDILKRPVKFADFKGKKKCFLIVNIATGCQLANQNFKELNQLYAEYADRGLEILCFPTNDFYNREPKCNADIELYLKEHFKPSFLVFEKTFCNGENSSPVYQYLRSHTLEFKASPRKSIGARQSIEYKPIPLTYAKFLLDGNGKVKGYFEPVVYPKSIKPQIELLL